MATGQPKLNIVELFFTDSGLPDWFVTNKLPILDTQGRVMGIMGAVHSLRGPQASAEALPAVGSRSDLHPGKLPAAG